ncbi:cilia- and flagella-associated protein 418-like [Saccoglossus kowalevskii]|uniref:Cilia- and flagella-associated protein 418 n=1 Tax=Saccoglossus kowalevskii TaxID=10224 RepID=A0ABM0GWS0_SACKO|nr:PREDICTED: protein C8orf37-like [Saccoglossus kowalevskii]
MDDDIDDLLDEVETKFCANSPRKSNKDTRNTTSNTRKRSGTKKSSGFDEDLDAMIDDICDVPEPLEKIEIKRERSTSLNSNQQMKCFPVYIGGSKIPQGLGTTMSQRSCDKLRCTDCDFKVVMYDNFEWHPSCDYLFLRNNVPDFKKLSAKLNKKKGYRAYACQCKWRSVREFVDLQKETDLKWVCGKHTE